MDVTFDEDAHEFFIDYIDWATSLSIGEKWAFMVNNELNKDQIASMERIADRGALFNNNVTSASIQFDISATAFVSAKDMAAPSAQAFGALFEFGVVQGIKEGNLLVEYWGLLKTDGRVFVHSTLFHNDEVDTSDAAKPFTRLPELRADIKLIPSTRPGFHAFRIHAKHFDHPQFIVNRSQTNQLPGELTPHLMLLRNAKCKIDLTTIFAMREKKSGTFTGISSAAWRVQWDHTATYEEKLKEGGGNEFVASTTGPKRSDLMPTRGAPSSIEQREKDVLAMAQAGSPFLTPDVLNARIRASTVETTADNPDFDPAFVTRLHR